MYPRYSYPERVADGTVHLIGLAGSIAAGTALIIWCAMSLSGWDVTAVAIYAGTIIFSFAASLAYHFTPVEAIRPFLRRVDHAAIFLKIAGTYTPLAFLINTPFAYTVLGCVWAVALSGAIAKTFFWRRPGTRSMVLYLALGWASLLLLWPLWEATTPLTVGLIVTGGLINSAGIYFFNQDEMRYSMAIWHAHVVVATAFYFSAIWIALGHGG